ncbi:hypothetical protein FQR65_LT14721 [Abscondita terminalis]|nr:hypothetical protein FQR65_LT14721 [Abscondita terminalis]
MHLAIVKRMADYCDFRLAGKQVWARRLEGLGDDSGLKCMKAVGVAACPADAVEEIKQISHYVSGLGGGKGVVRELIEKTLKLQDKWYDDTNVKSV